MERLRRTKKQLATTMKNDKIYIGLVREALRVSHTIYFTVFNQEQFTATPGGRNAPADNPYRPAGASYTESQTTNYRCPALEL